MSSIGSLAGIKVLDLSRLLPGPYCSMVLADHGAEVIAIEDSRFKDDDLFFQSLYRNKRHLSLNLKSEEGLEIFFKLAKDADVLIEGFRPGVVARLGVDYDSINSVNSSIIYCSITGYGQNGPFKNRAGHDVNYLATAGILDLIGSAGGPPAIPGVQFADIAGGSMNAVIGILLALYARTRTGQGQYIDISMTDGLLGFLTLPHFFSNRSSTNPRRSNELLSHRYGCYNTYRTADNHFISIGAVEKRFWEKLCKILGVDEYVELQYDDMRRQEIIGRLEELFCSKTVDEWDRILTDSDVCYSRVLTLEEVLNHQLFRERRMVFDSGADDSVLHLATPVKLSKNPGTIRSEPDQFGGSTADILAELGYSPEQVEDFDKRGVT